MDFKQSLNDGRVYETATSKLLMSYGATIMPVYEKAEDEFKGPQIFFFDGELVAPDMMVFKNASSFFVEVKSKGGFTWHRITERWTTGIDLKYYEHYLKVEEITNVPVYLFFFHKGHETKDQPKGMKNPTGLYANRLSFLSQNINHIHENWGKGGMVYWSEDVLKSGNGFYMPYEDVLRYSEEVKKAS